MRISQKTQLYSNFKLNGIVNVKPKQNNYVHCKHAYVMYTVSHKLDLIHSGTSEEKIATPWSNLHVTKKQNLKKP